MQQQASGPLQMDAAARASRLSFLEIADEDRRLLQELAEVLDPHLETLLQRWHAFLRAQPETRELLASARVQDHLRTVQTRYFRSLLQGPSDAAYFEDRLHVGLVHQRVGLEPAWYLGSYRKFTALVRQLLGQLDFDSDRVLRWGEALEKVVLLDADLALEAYFRARGREILAAVEALRDTTGKLESRNQELARQYRLARRSTRVRDEFLARISHELRSPLHAIIGFSDLLADGIEGPLNPGQLTSIQKIRHHGERLATMIDQMLAAVRTAASDPASLGRFGPKPILERLVTTTREEAKRKGLRFEAIYPHQLPDLLGEAQGFALALGHVLDNAVKFTDTGTVTLTVEVIADTARFLVEDTGPGCPGEHRETVFEPFFQEDTGDTRSVSGVGMGLTLARQTVEGFGGSLSLARTGPTGSLFVLELRLHGAETEASQ